MVRISFLLLLIRLAASESLQRFTLPEPIIEASGLVVAQAGGMWVHNDSDDDHLYRIDLEGNKVTIKQKVVVSGTAQDWEDLSAWQTDDNHRYLLCADCGDNAGRRKSVRAVIVKTLPGQQEVAIERQQLDLRRGPARC